MPSIFGKSLVSPYLDILFFINSLEDFIASNSEGSQYFSNFLYQFFFGRMFFRSILFLKINSNFFNFFNFRGFDGFLFKYLCSAFFQKGVNTLNGVPSSLITS